MDDEEIMALYTVVTAIIEKSGIGRKLLISALNHAKVETVTVSAPLSSVTAYENYGFERSGEVAESAGLVYQPMELNLNKAMLATSACIAP